MWGEEGAVYYIFAKYLHIPPSEVDKLPKGLVDYMLRKLEEEMRRMMAEMNCF